VYFSFLEFSFICSSPRHVLYRFAIQPSHSQSLCGATAVYLHVSLPRAALFAVRVMPSKVAIAESASIFNICQTTYSGLYSTLSPPLVATSL
jgi:hypothetical protein